MSDSRQQALARAWAAIDPGSTAQRREVAVPAAPRSDAGSVQVNVRLPVGLAEELKVYAASTGRSLTSSIRLAVEQWLERERS